MSRAVEESNRRMLRARDTMDRDYAKPLDVAALARVAHVSPVHFIRTFRATFGEPRIDTCNAGGWSGPCSCCARVIGASPTFRDIVGESPMAYRRYGPVADVPTCFAMAGMRPRS